MFGDDGGAQRPITSPHVARMAGNSADTNSGGNEALELTIGVNSANAAGNDVSLRAG